MRLISMSTKNYRTLDGVKLPFGKGYCTLSGRNNAGKSGVIWLLSALFRPGPSYPWSPSEVRFIYKEDKTQWTKGAGPIEVDFTLSLARDEDPALISFVEAIASRKIVASSVELCVSYSVAENDSFGVSVLIDGQAVDSKVAREIDRRIKASNLMFLYNSTTPQGQYYYGRGRRRLIYEFVMSDGEKKALDEAEKYTQRRLRKVTRQRTQDLRGIIGRLADKYDVEVSPIESYADRSMPMGISLRDRSVEVSLDDWGSGTQNRTHILMAILQANRIKTTDSPDERITPFVVIEEPESFLHPSAQAEFGRLLRELSDELGIQIIATTHSPYMLNLEEPAANVLLSRRVSRGKPVDTIVVDTGGDNWMAPFAEHLGISAAEFTPLRNLFAAKKSKVLLVEGPSDQEYFQFMQHTGVCGEKLLDDIDVVPYGGKDTLKNTLLVQFVLRTFDELFITFDLDAEKEVTAALARVGLKQGDDYVALGLPQPGKDCIEGLLPSCVLSAVTGRETDLVMKLGSRDSGERRAAKETLKRMFLGEFKTQASYKKEDVKELSRIIRKINSRFAGGGAVEPRPRK